MITQWVFLLVERSVPAELYRLYEERQFCDHCYNLDPLTLSPLGTLPIQQLAHELGTKRGKSMVLTVQNADEVCAIGEGLPLYSILALDNILHMVSLASAVALIWCGNKPFVSALNSANMASTNNTGHCWRWRR